MKLAELLYVLQGSGLRSTATAANKTAEADLELEAAAEDDDDEAAVHVGGDDAAQEDLHVGATGKRAGIS